MNGMESDSQTVPSTPRLPNLLNPLCESVVPSVDLSSQSHSNPSHTTSPSTATASIDLTIDPNCHHQSNDDQIVPQIPTQSSIGDESDHWLDSIVSPISSQLLDTRCSSSESLRSLSGKSVSSPSVDTNWPKLNVALNDVLANSGLNLRVRIKRKLISNGFDRKSRQLKRRVSIFYEELDQNCDQTESEVDFFHIQHNAPTLLRCSPQQQLHHNHNHNNHSSGDGLAFL